MEEGVGETDWGSKGGYARARVSKSGDVLYGFRSCMVTVVGGECLTVSYH